MTNINNSYLNANTLTIAGTKIKQDADGRFCLNDCHKASGGDPNKRPQMWLRNDQTQDLIKEITDAQICASPLSTVKGGIDQGTYAVKELVYAYAMWISPAFHLQVIRAYDALINGQMQQPQFAIPKSYSEALRLAYFLSDFFTGMFSFSKASLIKRLALSALLGMSFCFERHSSRASLSSGGKRISNLLGFSIQRLYDNYVSYVNNLTANNKYGRYVLAGVKVRTFHTSPIINAIKERNDYDKYYTI